MILINFWIVYLATMHISQGLGQRLGPLWGGWWFDELPSDWLHPCPDANHLPIRWIRALFHGQFSRLILTTAQYTYQPVPRTLRPVFIYYANRFYRICHKMCPFFALPAVRSYRNYHTTITKITLSNCFFRKSSQLYLISSICLTTPSKVSIYTCNLVPRASSLSKSNS